MEDIFEKVVKLQEKTGASLEDAKAALEQTNGDLLDAAILLEKEGKTEKKTSFYSTSEDKSSAGDVTGEVATRAAKEKKEDSEFKKGCKNFGNTLSKILDASIKNMFIVNGKEKELIRIPILVLILLLFFAFWIMLPLLIVGLFLGCNYQFEGVSPVTVDVNKACEKASQAAETIKEDLNKNNGENTDH